MSDTAGTGAVSTVTHQYTSVATNGTVAVGQFISIYSGAATIPAFTSRITAVSGGSGSVWVITYSTSAKSGSQPTTGSTYKAQVGGAWKGPNAASGFPFDYATASMSNSNSDITRINLKNNATYSISSGVTRSLVGPIIFQGYTSSVGDGGKCILDGGSNAIAIVTLSSVLTELRDCIAQNNGSSGSNSGFASSSGGNTFTRCVANTLRGSGFSITSGGNRLVECEAYACNSSNTANLGGFVSSSNTEYIFCVSHDHNAGANAHGFVTTATNTSMAVYLGCISDTNGGSGFLVASSATATFANCVAYNNTSDGITHGGNGSCYVMNCVLSANAAYGVSTATSNSLCYTYNCAFFSNTSGQTNNINTLWVLGSITLTGDPFAAAATGDFTLNNTGGAGAACRAAGRGAFTETQASYTGTVGYPDVGAAQSQAAGGSGVVKFAGNGGGFAG